MRLRTMVMFVLFLVRGPFQMRTKTHFRRERSGLRVVIFPNASSVIKPAESWALPCCAAIMYVTGASNQLSHDNRSTCAALGSVNRGINWDSTVADCTNLWNAKPSFHSLHPGGAQFVLVDGSARFIGQDVDLTTFRRLGNRKDGNPAQVP